jgi:LPXTG-motif cell wall-anchored protein
VIGEALEYDVVVTNTGNVTVTGVEVTDPNADTLVCAPSNPADLAPGERITCNAAHVVTQADLDARSVSNVAFVSASTPVGPSLGEASVDIVVLGAPGVVSGRVWADLDRDGAIDSNEVDISGVTVRLTAPGADGVDGTADDVVRSTVTSGPYEFTDVPIGQPLTITVDESTLPSDLRTATFDLDGVAVVQLDAPGERREVDFGYTTRELPRTGGSTGQPLRIAVILLLTGAVLLFAGRRRRALT